MSILQRIIVEPLISCMFQYVENRCTLNRRLLMSGLCRMQRVPDWQTSLRESQSAKHTRQVYRQRYDHALLWHYPGLRTLQLYKVLSHLNRKCLNVNMVGWKSEVHLGKSAKSRVRGSKSLDYDQQTFSSTSLIFSSATDLNMLLAWFLDLKMWHRNIRHPSRKYKYWYRVLVLFTV